MEKEPTGKRSCNWVARYAMAIHVLGVVVIVLSLAYGIIIAVASWGKGLNSSQQLLILSGELHAINAFGYGLVAIGLAQLLKYIFHEIETLGWLFRHASMVLCVWAGVGLLAHIMSIVIIPLEHIDWRLYIASIAYVTPLARFLSLLTIAIILRRVLPILNESRTVV